MGFFTELIAQQPGTSVEATESIANWPVLICLLGSFRLLKKGQPIVLRNADKTRTLLIRLALERSYCVSRDALLQALWPDVDVALACKSLNSLNYSLHRLLNDTLGGTTPVLYADGCYRLNVEAGIGTDVACFEALTIAGEQHEHAGDHATAMRFYLSAVQLYHGDLCVATDVQTLLIGESLRAQYLTLLARLAAHDFTEQDFSRCAHHTLCLLAADPCREDAHRLLMRCYMRQGQRAQALRQYRLCESILRAEFGIAPEPETTALYHQICTTPQSI